MKLNITAYAKINLTLDVLNSRSDGYHNVKMIMQTIDLADQLTFSRCKQGIKIKTDNSELPTGPENLIYQAAQLLVDEFNLTGGVEIEVTKNIPIAAGLAGGSTNAAATLKAINELWQLGLTTEELMARASKLGADVPFCVVGGTKLATGIGTEITDLPAVPQLNLVVVNPPYQISTAEVYRHFSNSATELTTDQLLPLLSTADQPQVVANLANDLETAAVSLYPKLSKLKAEVEELTTKALISGSGPTVLGFVKDQSTGEQTANQLRERLSSGHQIVTATTVQSGLKSKLVASQ